MAAEFYDHPKVAKLPSEYMLPCVGLHLLAICWCNHQLMDGHIPEAQVLRLAGDLTLLLPDGEVWPLVKALVDVRMWERGNGDYIIHNYLKYQPSRAAVLALRESRSVIGKKGGEAKAKQTASNLLAGSQGSSQDTALANGLAKSCPGSGSVSERLDSESTTMRREDAKQTASNLLDGQASQLASATKRPTPPQSHKKPTTPGVKVVIDAYTVMFTAAHPGEKPNTTGKDGDLAKRLIQRHGQEKVLEVMGRMFASHDPWIKESGRTLGVLSSQWNKLVTSNGGPPARGDRTAGNAAAMKQAADFLKATMGHAAEDIFA